MSVRECSPHSPGYESLFSPHLQLVVNDRLSSTDYNKKKVIHNFYEHFAERKLSRRSTVLGSVGSFSLSAIRFVCTVCFP